MPPIADAPVSTPTTLAIDRDQLRADILKRCPQPYILRKPAAEIAGLDVRTLANMDSKNLGVPLKIRLGSRKLAYVTDSFVDWLVNRIEPA